MDWLWLTKASWKWWHENYGAGTYPSEIQTKLGLPDESTTNNLFSHPRQFNPFRPKISWERPEVLQRFKRHIAKDEYSHTILAGPSGSGKTIFLKDIVAKEFVGRAVRIDIYNNFLHDLIRSMPCVTTALRNQKDKIATAIEEHLKTAKPRPIVEAFEEKFPDQNMVKLVEDAKAFFEAALLEPSEKGASAQPFLFVFDQIERFLSNIRYYVAHSSELTVADEIYGLIQLLKKLRQIHIARTVFAIREDALFESIDFLTYSLDEPGKADCVFKYMYFYGISNDEKAIDYVEQQFDNAGIKNAISFGEFKKFLALESRSTANTFFIQLAGYMIENFWMTKNGVEDLFVNTERKYGPRDLLPLFFDELIAGFRRRHPISYPITASYDICRTVLLTIAIENRKTGNPITKKKIALLAHIPESYVKPVVDYLYEIGVVCPDYLPKANADHPDVDRRDRAVRFAHDMLFEHILESEKFFVHDDNRINAELRLNIERLSDRRVDDKDLIPIRRFGSVWYDAFYHHEIGAIAIVIFIIYGACIGASSLIPNYGGYHTAVVCDTIRNGWNIFWSYWTNVHVETCEQLKWYYFLMYPMDCAWVSFIYKLDRGYLQYVLSEKPKLAWISKMTPVLGAVLGLFTRFTPILLLIPLFTGGLIMAVFLIATGETSWGKRTGINMILTLVLLPVIWFMVSDNMAIVNARNTIDLTPMAFTAKNITMWLIAISFMWFFSHIRPEQQGEISYAARLAAFDAARKPSS